MIARICETNLLCDITAVTMIKMITWVLEQKQISSFSLKNPMMIITISLSATALLILMLGCIILCWRLSKRRKLLRMVPAEQSRDNHYYNNSYQSQSYACKCFVGRFLFCQFSSRTFSKENKI